MDIKGRNFLKLLDFTPEEINGLVELAARLKADKKAGREKQMLKGKNIVLLFEKDSTRTRCAFEVGAYDQGAQVTYLGPTGSQMGKKESIADTARVLGRMYDGIEYRGYGQDIVEDLAKYAGVVVWNGLTTEFHPTQILADLLTMKEHSDKPFKEMKFCYLGDARNNMGNSLMVGCAKMGIDFRAACPKSCAPSDELVAKCREVAADSRAVVDAPADALTRAYALEVIDQPCAHIWRDFLDCYLEDVVLGVVRNPSVGLSYDARGMICRVDGLHNGRSCCCCRL